MRVSDTDSPPTLRSVLVLVACVAVLGGAFAVLVAADGALRWLAGVVAAAAVLATLAAAVRVFAALSLRLEPRDDPRR